MSSLGARLVLAVTGITAVVVLVAGGGMWLAVREALMREVDRELAGRMERIRRFDQQADRGPWRGGRGPPPEGRAEREAPRRLLQVLSSMGVELGRSQGLPPGDDLWAGGEPPADGTLTTVRLQDGEPIRVIAVAASRVPPGTAYDGDRQPGDGVVALVGHGLAEVEDELHRLAAALGMLWLVATVLAGGAALALRRAVLRPLRALDTELARLGPEDLSARLPATVGPSEARAVVDRLNALLASLEEGFRREQATIANIAHELRTPVAGLRAEIEFRLLAAADADEQAVLRRLLATVGRMQTIVGNVLMLARLEAGREDLPRTEVDAAAVLAAVLERWEPRAAARGLALEIPQGAATPLMTSPVHLDLVLDNLIGNAVAHSATPGQVEVRLEVIDGRCRIAVVNPCSAAIDPARLGTAFYRADAARSDGAHCGLGLALTLRVVRLLDGTLDLSAREGGFAAVLDLPAIRP